MFVRRAADFAACLRLASRKLIMWRIFMMPWRQLRVSQARDARGATSPADMPLPPAPVLRRAAPLIHRRAADVMLMPPCAMSPFFPPCSSCRMPSPPTPLLSRAEIIVTFAQRHAQFDQPSSRRRHFSPLIIYLDLLRRAISCRQFAATMPSSFRRHCHASRSAMPPLCRFFDFA